MPGPQLDFVRIVGSGNIMETRKNQFNSLRNERVCAVLDRLYDAARGDRMHIFPIMCRLVVGRLLGRTFSQSITPSMTKDIYMPVSREEGEFMYVTARVIGAKRVVEFGTSFGISTIYLAAAVRDNGGDTVIGTEVEPSKHEQAVANIKEAGFNDITDIRLGDALETLKKVPEPLDLVLLDGWKDLYLPVLKLLIPNLRPGAVVLADNTFTFTKSLRPYVEYMQSGRNGFESVTLPFKDGLEYSYYLG